MAGQVQDRPIRCELVRTGERFAALAEPWTALWTAADGSLFQSHAWLSAWWRTTAERPIELRLVAGWQDGTLVALLPLSLCRHSGFRVLEWAGKDITDYCDALVRPDLDRASTIEALWSVAAEAGGYDLAYLSHLHPGSLVDQAFRAESRPGRAPALACGHRRAVSLRVLSAWGSGVAWFDSLPKRPRANHRQSLARFERSGRIVFRMLGPDEAVRPVLERLIAFKRIWLARRGHASPLFGGNDAMLASLVEAAASLGRLRVFVAECDGRVVAGSLTFLEHDRLMTFLNAFDPAVEKASPGMLLIVHTIRWAFDRGIREVDFLCGAEEYKRRFANTEAELSSLVGARTLAGRAALAIDRWAGAIGRRQPRRQIRRRGVRAWPTGRAGRD